MNLGPPDPGPLVPTTTLNPQQKEPDDEQLKIIQGAWTRGRMPQRKPTRCSWDASSSLTRMKGSDG